MYFIFSTVTGFFTDVLCFHEVMQTGNQSVVSKMQYMHPRSGADSPWDEERKQAEFQSQTTQYLLRATSAMWRAEQWHP